MSRLVESGSQRDDRRGANTDAAAGSSLPELLGVLMLMGLALATATVYVDSMAAPLRTGGEMLEGLLTQARARAVSTTTAHRVRAAQFDLLVVETADSCSSGSWAADPSMDVELPNGVWFAATDWEICFSRRGIASNNVVVTLRHTELGSQQLEVLQGGVTRWLE